MASLFRQWPMGAMLSSPVSELARLVALSPAEAVDQLASALEQGEISLESSAVGIDAVRGVSPESAQRAVIAFRLAQGRMDDMDVATTLRVANEVRRVERVDRPDIEIVWTGPDADGPLVRPTAAVVEEMIRSVSDSGEILIVGYALTAETGSVMRLIVDLLGHAAERHARITLVLHKDQESQNRANLLAAWNVFAKKPRILTWRPPATLPYTKLHAKVMVVDRLDALVTSANLTVHGLESNLELGLRVRGSPARSIAERFDHLIAAGVLQEWLENTP